MNRGGMRKAGWDDKAARGHAAYSGGAEGRARELGQEVEGEPAGVPALPGRRGAVWGHTAYRGTGWFMGGITITIKSRIRSGSGEGEGSRQGCGCSWGIAVPEWGKGGDCAC